MGQSSADVMTSETSFSNGATPNYISQALAHASIRCTPKPLVPGQNDFEGFSVWREEDAHNNCCLKPHTLTSMTMMKASLAAMTCQ